MIELIRGRDETVIFNFYDDEEETTPTDLTDATVTITKSNMPVSPTPSIEDAVNGLVHVVWTDTDTDDMRVDQTYKFRLTFTYPGGVDDTTPDILVVAR